MPTTLKATDASEIHPATPNTRASDPLLGNRASHPVGTLRGAEPSPPESGKEWAASAAADWRLIQRLMQGVLGDDNWPKGRTIDGKAQLDTAENGERLWRVGHQSYRVLRHEPHGIEELIEAGPAKIRRIGSGVILEEYGIVTKGAQSEPSPSHSTERDASDPIRRRGARRGSTSRSSATGPRGRSRVTP
jgi:hypothetical protein